jgi:3-oxoacyl-[acyl-carrier-protein] synthase-3
MMPVYINAVGSFLPGEPVGNETIAEFLGPFDRKQTIIGHKALKQNGIQFRHYVIDRTGKPLFDNAGMAAHACRAALGRSEVDPGGIEYLSAAASQGDLMAPGFASMVHGDLDLPPIEVASFNSFCASGMMAIGAAHKSIASGSKRRALACASEFASRFLRHGYFAGSTPSIESEFLRWGLSDGAGALVLEDRPNAHGLSLRIKFVDLVSYAGQFEPCMYGGAVRNGDGRLGLPWSNYPTLHDAVGAGAFHLQQDFDLLENIIPVGLNR